MIIYCGERRGAMKASVAIKIKKVIAKIAKKSASIEANTACPLWNYQPKEPDELNFFCYLFSI